MSSVHIEIAERRTQFAPRETVTGRVSWACDNPPTSAELRLLWCARGRGQEDEDIVQTLPFPAPQAVESRPFTVVLPDAPYSFSGTLITLDWSLELVVHPGDQSDRVGIVLAPGGNAVALPCVKRA
jgi:hypothetical protein